MRTTPQWLETGQYATFGAAALLMITVVLGARSHRQAMQAVGKDSAPSIIAAQHIRAALADMDANAANELLDDRTSGAARKAYEARRKEAVESIVTAAQNITYGDAELIPVRKLAYGLGTYTAMMQRARDLHEAGDRRFIAEWRAAAQYMDNTVLPAAALAKIFNNPAAFWQATKRDFSMFFCIFNQIAQRNFKLANATTAHSTHKI